MNFTFGNQKALYYLPALMALGIFLFYNIFKRKKIIADFMANFEKHALIINRTHRLRVIRIILFLIGGTFLILAYMRPQNGYELREISHHGSDIFAVIDVSDSMLAEDLKPNRMERTKRELLDLLPYLKGDRIGLIAFSGNAYVLCPLTTDYETFGLFVNDLDTNILTLPGTNLKEAIKLAFQSFDEGNPDNRAVFIVTDGEITQGEATDIIDEAGKANVRLYIMGMGTLEGSPIPSKENGDFIKDNQGNIVISKLNENNLKSFALNSHGMYVRSVTSDDDVKALYLEGIKKDVAQRDVAGGEKKIPLEVYYIPLALALLFIVFEWLFESL